MASSVTRRAFDKNETPAPASLPNTQQLLSAADAARDSRRWPQAAELYAEYLTARSDDGPIWVQFGHALKKSGKLDEAEDAYKRSLDLTPDVADTQLQLGHLYKKMRKFSDAIAAYREAARLGFGAFGYAPSNDALARVALLEELLSSVSNIVSLRPARTS